MLAAELLEMGGRVGSQLPGGWRPADSGQPPAVARSFLATCLASCGTGVARLGRVGCSAVCRRN